VLLVVNLCAHYTNSSSDSSDRINDNANESHHTDLHNSHARFIHNNYSINTQPIRCLDVLAFPTTHRYFDAYKSFTSSLLLRAWRIINFRTLARH